MDRVTKGTTGQEIWNNLNNALKSRMNEYYTILGNAHNLFGEAVKAFDAHAHEGTSLICRATLETACYLFLTSYPGKDGVEIVNPLSLDGEIRAVSFEELARAIRKRRILSLKQVNALGRIQKNGNLIAHLASHHAKVIARFERESRRFNREIVPRKDLSDEERAKFERKVLNTLKFWLDEDEVLEDLRDTASILLALARHVPHQNIFVKTTGQD